MARPRSMQILSSPVFAPLFDSLVRESYRGFLARPRPMKNLSSALFDCADSGVSRWRGLAGCRFSHPAGSYLAGSRAVPVYPSNAWEPPRVAQNLGDFSFPAKGRIRAFCRWHTLE